MKDLYHQHKPQSELKNSVNNFLKKQISSNKSIIELAPFLLYISFCLVFYINNSYRAEAYVREIHYLENVIKDLRSEYITTKSELMFASKQTEVENLVYKHGLKKNTKPPYIIYINN